MKHNSNKRILLSVYAAAGTLLLTGFTSFAAEPGYRAAEYGNGERAALVCEEDGFRTGGVCEEEAVPEWNLAGITAGARGDAVETVRSAAEKAQADYEAKLEAERKAEEERRMAEEREAAEAAARAQAEAEAMAARIPAAEQELLAALIFCEAGNQPYEGQVAVGAVVMNRVKSGVYPDTITDVIYQSGQFTPAMTGWLDSVLASGGYTDSARQAAADAIAGSNPVGDCLYFNTGGSGLQIGDHFFH